MKQGKKNHPKGKLFHCLAFIFKVSLIFQLTPGGGEKEQEASPSESVAINGLDCFKSIVGFIFAIFPRRRHLFNNLGKGKESFLWHYNETTKTFKRFRISLMLVVTNAGNVYL